MKKFLSLAIACLLAAGFAGAQEKGQMYISGSIGASGGNRVSAITTGSETTKTTTPSTSQFSIAPKFGFFVIDNLEVNLSLGFENTRTYDDKDGDVKLWDRDNMFYITPGVNYHIGICDKLFYTPGLHLSIGFGSYVDQINANTSTKYGSTAFGIGLDLMMFEYRACEHFAITLNAGSLEYEMTHSSHSETIANATVTTKTTRNSVNFGLNMGASIGFKYYF